ncbi:MAG TPA: hypothetical protein ENI27_10920 [bacterium]|nr:hypothetical protein [bacterium]
MSETLLVIVAVLLYLLGGVVWTLAYVMVFRPEKTDAALGLIVIFWLPFAVIDLLLGSIARPFGKVTKSLMVKLAPAGSIEPEEGSKE